MILDSLAKAPLYGQLGPRVVRGLAWPHPKTSRFYYRHHNLELKDAATFCFGEAWRL